MLGHWSGSRVFAHSLDPVQISFSLHIGWQTTSKNTLSVGIGITHYSSTKNVATDTFIILYWSNQRFKIEFNLRVISFCDFVQLLLLIFNLNSHLLRWISSCKNSSISWWCSIINVFCCNLVWLNFDKTQIFLFCIKFERCLLFVALLTAKNRLKRYFWCIWLNFKTPSFMFCF